ncbi:prepilin-type N-terminal cleavage/methylation domain-containing protein [Tissierella sp. MSJ-40]|uniref:Prepilin-type N-terminal cleavage/methylation domain-containing protein n=1 Tax=Tissierella simiarum TaxID=2841534 RepID=A0ABS6E411_9FIRM|nr:prepilin-type N-terminal cleavage/methylation domain-containing protein [Tissierella simiarum]MBU5437517.1 prepilin-type N-terminal cleavage/methylation domain-containing protein [Tissierella simiarum]
MWNIKSIYQKSRGFTLIEILLILSLISLIIISLYSVLNFCVSAWEDGNRKDEIILNGRYGIEFIKTEIKTADKIISSNKIDDFNFTYPNNIGFVILRYNSNEYQYITYYLSNDKLIRITDKRVTKKYPSINTFSGFNEICEYVDTIERTNVDFSKNMIYLNITMSYNNRKVLEFKTNIFIRCPVEY